MTVHFVYRCDVIGEPTALYRRRFDDATVIDWFRNHWQTIEEPQDFAHAEALLGTDVYSFSEVFRYVRESGMPPPTTIEEVRDALSWCYHTEIRYEEHCVQVLTDDDDTDMAYYFFDDAFAAAHPDLTAYLLLDGPLPDGAGEPGWRPADEDVGSAVFRGTGEGRIYVVAQIRDDSSLLEDLAASDVDLIEGLRLPEMCRQLMNLGAAQAEDWGWYCFENLRETLLGGDLTEDHERAFVQALQAEPGDEATWRAYADWLMERDGPSPGCRLLRQALPRLRGLQNGDPGRNVVHVGEHVVHLCLHGGADSFDQLILFDDLWGAAHPALAGALIRLGGRWDVLSTGDEDSI